MKPWMTCAEDPPVVGPGQQAALPMPTRHVLAEAEPAGPVR